MDLDNPKPEEIKYWMKINELNIITAADSLGISKRQFSRFLSGETNAKRVHTLAMQMVWLIKENKKELQKEYNSLEKPNNKKTKKISIQIK